MSRTAENPRPSGRGGCQRWHTPQLIDEGVTVEVDDAGNYDA